eukprot:Pgem_evm1s2900
MSDYEVVNLVEYLPRDLGVKKGSVFEISCYKVWAVAFDAYISDRTEYEPELLNYLQQYKTLIAKCAEKYNWLFVSAYDQEFRSLAQGAGDLNIWLKHDKGLYNKHFTLPTQRLKLTLNKQTYHNNKNNKSSLHPGFYSFILGFSDLEEYNNNDNKCKHSVMCISDKVTIKN